MKTRVIIAIKLNTVFAIVKKSLEILFFRLYFHYSFSSVHNCKDHSHFHLHCKCLEFVLFCFGFFSKLKVLFKR